MTESGNPMGTAIILAALFFIVYRILIALNERHDQTGASSTGSGGNGGAKVIPMPSRISQALPDAITLRRDEHPPDDSPFSGEEMARDADDLLIDDKGLRLVGDYTVAEMPGFFLRAYTHPDLSLVAILYRDPLERIWLNLLTRYADGRIITTSSADKGAIKTERPRGMPLFLFSGMPFDQLFRRHKLETQQSEKGDPIGPDQFVEFFQENYSRLRQGLQERVAEEERREAQRSYEAADEDELRQTPLSFDQEEEIDLGQEEGMPSAPTTRQLQQWLAAIYKVVNVPSDRRDEFQDGLVYVQNGTPMDALAETIDEYVGITVTEVEGGRWVIRSDEGAEDIIEPGDLDGPALFDKVNASLPEGRRFFKIPVSLQGVAFYSRLSLNF